MSLSEKVKHLFRAVPQLGEDLAAETIVALVENEIRPSIEGETRLQVEAELRDKWRNQKRRRGVTPTSSAEVSAESAVSRQEEEILVSGERDQRGMQGGEKRKGETGIFFPVDGGGGQWELPAALLAELQSAYPSLDARGEANKARVWVIANPTKRKTHDGMPRFLFNWLKRAQNNAGERAPAPYNTQTARAALPTPSFRPSTQAERDRINASWEAAESGGEIVDMVKRLAEGKAVK